MVSRAFLIGTVAAVIAALAGGVIGWRLRGPVFPLVETPYVAVSPASVPSPSPINRAKQRVAHEAFCADVSVLPSIITDLRHGRYFRFSQRLGALANRLQQDLGRFLTAGDDPTYNRWSMSVSRLTGKNTGPEFFQMVGALEDECRSQLSPA